MSTAFRILPFQVLTPTSGVTLLATPRGLVRIHDPRMTELLQYLAAKGLGHLLEEATWSQVLAARGITDTAGAIRFLKDAGVLRSASPGQRRFSAGRLAIHPENEPTGLEGLIADLEAFTGLPFSRGLCATVAAHEFVVMYLRDHDPAAIRELQWKVRAAGSAAVLFSYFVGRSLIIDAPYIPDAGTPCHFCQTRAGRAGCTRPGATPPAWMDVLSDLQLPPGALSGLEHPLRPTDWQLGGLLLRNRVKELLGPHEVPVHSRTFLDAIQVDIDNLITVRDVPAIHPDCEQCA